MSFDQKELTFNQVLLKHLDRISVLSTNVIGDIYLKDGTVTISKEKDKHTALIWAIMILEALIPGELKDKKLDKELAGLKENKDASFDVVFYMRKLQTFVNLLARKNMLYEFKGIAEYIKSKENEEFED
jgi:hypothetical protein